MHEFWFEPKMFGWGFMPVTLEGWLATFGLLMMVALSAYLNNLLDKKEKKNIKALLNKDSLRFVFELILIIAVFTALFADRVEGGLQWRGF